jgi:hypothetical protein
MGLRDFPNLRPRLTQADLVVALLPAFGAWAIAWLAVDRLGVQYRELGITPDGPLAWLVLAPWLLLAWPLVVVMAWAVWRSDARNRKRLQGVAHGGSAVILAACAAMWLFPILDAVVKPLL